MKACPKCGTKNLNSKKYCDECGTSLGLIPNQEDDENISNNSEIITQIKVISDKLSKIELNTKKGNSFAISDINMPFASMVVFMIKWAIATIPAVIILFILGSILTSVFGGLFSMIFGWTNY
ncbi:zinc-ribbon domain-containing protein [Desulforhopalus singaporensis]|uniref:Zinc-ribbon domain-containing protein n=1 Tax=Desulforhopalus singaporensis TaxID=91360 RepID=A0A1H0VWK5_9BACT|nr:zinc ribbon domain-containing protein [Desulforhopalus singaporensis]SDP82723.1 zinc-ribbon domain-containing protein [Desulforhopalus singaporensis]